MKNKKKQNGGILLKMEPKEAFEYFVKNSQIKYMSSGSYGVIMEALFKENLNNSPYEMFRESVFKNPVQKILIKLVALSDKPSNKNAVWKDHWSDEKQIEQPDNFIKEVNIQTEVFFKTMEYLDPLCPAPVYSTILRDKNEILEKIDLFFKHADPHNPETKNSLGNIKKNIENDVISSLGILGMEIAHGYTTMHKYQTETSNIYHYMSMVQMSKLQILKLALKTGYSHNDFHMGNILINNHSSRANGHHILLIDFGLASKLKQHHLHYIREKYQQKKYSEALEPFEHMKRSDGLELDEYPDYYGWLWNDPVWLLKKSPKFMSIKNAEYDKMIQILINQEETEIDERIALFDKQHAKYPDMYPYLPLSNSIKNSFYQGMIETIDTIPDDKSVNSKSKTSSQSTSIAPSDNNSFDISTISKSTKSTKSIKTPSSMSSKSKPLSKTHKKRKRQSINSNSIRTRKEHKIE